jgi:NADH-quinone oxidoreductase subunit M
MGQFLLNLTIFAPLVAAVVVWTLPQRREHLAYPIALWVGLGTGAAAILLWLAMPAAGANTRSVMHPTGETPIPNLIGETKWTWVEAGDLVRLAEDAEPATINSVVIRYHVALDAISGPLFALTGLLVPLAVACSLTSIRERVREYYAWLLLLTTAMFGVFASRDVLLFYVFFELTLVPLFFLIGIWGGPERRYAASKFFIFTFVGSVLTFAGIVYLAIRGAAGGIVDFDLVRLSSLNLSLTEQVWLFVAFFAGFAIKVPFFPLHTWLPLAHTEAPTAGSVLLAGILLKLGTYGFLRFSLPMVPEGAEYWAAAMGALAVAGIIYGALVSWVQSDIKKLVAYSSVSHLGFCMLGMFSFLPIGLSGSVLYMINHGLSTGALFLVVGMIYERYHTRQMSQLGGLARQMPIMAAFLVIFVLSSIGLPGLNGFISEFTVLFAAFNSGWLGPVFGALGATGILLGAIYMLYVTGQVLFGPVKEPPHTPDLSTGLTRDLTRREIAILTPLAVMCVVLGVAPRFVTDSLDPALQSQVLARLEKTAPGVVAVDAGDALTPSAASFASVPELRAPEQAAARNKLGSQVPESSDRGGRP